MSPNNPIVATFSCIYYIFVVFPMSFFTKGAKGPQLFNFKKKPGGSYFHERNHTYRKEDFKEE